MIRINLLPVRQAKKAEQGKVQLAMGVIILAVGLGANYFVYAHFDGQLTTIQSQIVRTQAEIKQLDEIIGEVKDIEKRKEDLEKKLEIITKLRKARTGPVKMMDSLARKIPKEVWIDRLSEKKGKLLIVGSAKTHEDLARFMAELKSSPYFKNIVLEHAELGKMTEGKGKDKDIETVDFTINGVADYTAG